MEILQQIDKQRVPKHIAIIMDGNGRWAMSQSKERLFGHKHGLTAVREAVEGCVATGVKYLTLYTFSTENWNRPQAEVEGLMMLIIQAVKDETSMLKENGVKLELIGDVDRLPKSCIEMLDWCMQETADGKTMTLVLALSYSSRWEITNAVKKICREKLDPATITEQTISQHLLTSQYPEPDLMIRTGGEVRVSNFMLWQIAYSELYFSQQLWPDFKREDLYAAIVDYQKRQRRFGKTGQQVEGEVQDA
ncbi:MAG: isoprenyl transferase [Bacteroidales bacterium]|nr:isoprenyl transferase [Bacteroidales bacterium]